ncbi:MAG: hypothetical protein DIZ80_08205 [endosymbiont of Galathealinum brachiosum]|uniref:Uncharacterized protein n=1 Tax=endosymbiont of Galathealinum brachiosum TaxID=2200906 RepID=A0A370DGQ0_9GAMM|nr:MAG: hypothetical protein DIZ80_08205 [endosymbiont of Galathealinum brachiosum]
MNTQTVINLLGRELKVEYSKLASKQLSNLPEIVNLEMELQFSCMIKKRVFQSMKGLSDNAVKLNENMFLSFKPITTNVCAPKDVDIHNHESIEIFDIENPERFVPNWLLIDYQKGEWCGEFGYDKATR